MDNSWPFADPENMAVITIRQILQGEESILHVTHDRDDGGWQFLGRADASENDAKVVAFRRIFKLDPSIARLFDLPLGWHAWRKTPSEPWQRGVWDGTGAGVDWL